MADYTPSMGDMRARHALGVLSRGREESTEIDAEFDRFIARVRADAVKEFAHENYRVSMDCPNHCDDATTALARRWVDRIEKGAGE